MAATLRAAADGARAVVALGARSKKERCIRTSLGFLPEQRGPPAASMYAGCTGYREISLQHLLLYLS